MRRNGSGISAGRLALLLALLLTGLAMAGDDSTKPERPKLPPFFTTLDPVSTGVYDMRGEPVARAFNALRNMNERAWDLIGKSCPHIGIVPDTGEPKVHPGDVEDQRFYAGLANEDLGRSPIPLVSMIVSLDSSDLAEPLRSLREQLAASLQLENYDRWSRDDLLAATQKLTQPLTTVKGVKYQAPKRQLTFTQSVQLFAMTLSLLRKDTKWPEWAARYKAQNYTVPAVPDMSDFTSRLTHQLPVAIADGGTASFLLYEPGPNVEQPVRKGEFAERADVVNVQRSGAVFTLEQYPVYFTANQAEWSPAWIEPKDDMRDVTLMARKYEYTWTRFDGPYLYYRPDQLNGSITYRSTVRFQQGKIVIEAERFVAPRGGVIRVKRNPSYDPATMTALAQGATPPSDLNYADWLDVVEPRPTRKANRPNFDFFYRAEGRKFLSLQTGPNAFSSSLYPPPDNISPVQAAATGVTH